MKMFLRILFWLLIAAAPARAQFTNAHRSTLGVFSSIGNYDTDAQAFFTALESDASPTFLNSTQKNSVNALITSLKAHSLWTKYKAIYLFIGGTASAHKYNLKDPRNLDAAYRLTFPNGATHSSGGTDWTTTQYADTHMPSSLIVEGSTSVSIYHGENIQELGVSYGWDDGTKHGGLFMNYAGQLYSDFPAESTARIQISTSYDTRCMVHAAQTGTRTHTVYRNGSQIGTSTASATSAYTANNIWINARDLVNTFNGTKITSWFALANVGFSATDAANEYTDVQAFQTSNSRNF